MNADDVIHGEWHVRYNYSVGKVAGHFFEALKEKKILASHCSASGIAYLPPRAYCERAFEPCDGWVEVGHQGTVLCRTYNEHGFVISSTYGVLW